MSLMDCSIRSKPVSNENDSVSFNPLDPCSSEPVSNKNRSINFNLSDPSNSNFPWNLKPVEQKWKEYDESFPNQYSLMEKEIGCWLPVESHRLLIKAITLPNQTKGGILLSSMSKDSNVHYDMGLVIGIGPDAYRDKNMFRSGPRCKVGDWIDFAPMEKQKKHFNGYLCYFINDDRVNAPILDITTAVREYRGYSPDEVQKIMAEERSEDEIRKFMIGG